MCPIRTLTCPACSAPLEPGASSCPYCDTPLAIRAAPDAVDAAAILAAWEHAELSELRAAAARRPIDPAANYALGIAYSRMGLWDDALEPFRTAAEKVPENPDFQYAIAAALHELVLNGDTGRNRWVEDRLERALAVAPDHARSLALKAHREARAGDTAAMVETYARLVEASPADSVTFLATFIERNPGHAEAALLARPARGRLVREAATAATHTRLAGGCAGLAGLLLAAAVLSAWAGNEGLPPAYWAAILASIVVWAALMFRRAAAERRVAEARIATAEEEALLTGQERDPQALLAFAGELVRSIPPGGEFMLPGRPKFPA